MKHSLKEETTNTNVNHQARFVGRTEIEKNKRCGDSRYLPLNIMISSNFKWTLYKLKRKFHRY